MSMMRIDNPDAIMTGSDTFEIERKKEDRFRSLPSGDSDKNHKHQNNSCLM